MGTSPDIVTKIGYQHDPRGLQEARRDVQDYKIKSLQIGAEISRERARLLLLDRKNNAEAYRVQVANILNLKSAQLELIAKTREGTAAIASLTAELRSGGQVGKTYRTTLERTMQGFTLRGAAQTAGLFLGVQGIHSVIRGIVRTTREWLQDSLRLNSIFDSMRIGLAATLAQNARITDASGRQIFGLQAVIGLQQTSLDTQKKIVAAAFESGSTLDNFLDAFRLAVPLTLQLGGNIDDAIDVTKRLTLAATAIGIPFDLVRLQIDDILRGVVTTRTTLARVLGINQEQLRVERERGTIIEFVRQKTEAFLQSQELLAGTYQILLNRAQLLAQVVKKELGEGAFEVVRAVLNEIVGLVGQLDKKTGELKLNPEFAKIAVEAKDALREFFLILLDTAPAAVRVFDVFVRALGAAAGFAEILAGNTKYWLEAPIALATGGINAAAKVQRDAEEIAKAGSEHVRQSLLTTESFLENLASKAADVAARVRMRLATIPKSVAAGPALTVTPIAAPLVDEAAIKKAEAAAKKLAQFRFQQLPGLSPAELEKTLAQIQQLVDAPAEIQAAFQRAFAEGNLPLPKFSLEIKPLDAMRDALAKVGAEGALQNKVLEQEITTRKEIIERLKEEIRFRLVAAATVGIDREAVEKLVQELDSEKKALADVQKQTFEKTSIGQLIQGFEDITEVLGKFSAGLNKSFSQIGA